MIDDPDNKERDEADEPKDRETPVVAEPQATTPTVRPSKHTVAKLALISTVAKEDDPDGVSRAIEGAIAHTTDDPKPSPLRMRRLPTLGYFEAVRPPSRPDDGEIGPPPLPDDREVSFTLEDAPEITLSDFLRMDASDDCAEIVEEEVAAMRGILAQFKAKGIDFLHLFRELSEYTPKSTQNSSNASLINESNVEAWRIAICYEILHQFTFFLLGYLKGKSFSRRAATTDHPLDRLALHKFRGMYNLRNRDRSAISTQENQSHFEGIVERMAAIRKKQESMNTTNPALLFLNEIDFERIRI